MTESGHKTVKAYFNRASGSQIHYRTVRSTGIPILLIHYNASSSAMFERLMVPFAEAGYWPIAIDLPGCGMSDPDAGSPEIEDYAAASQDLVKSLVGDSPYVVLGHHVGASVALFLASRFGEEVIAGIGSALTRLPPDFAKELANHEWPQWDPHGTEIARYWQRMWNLEWTVCHLGVTQDIASEVTARSCAEMLLAHPRQSDGHRAVGRCDHDSLLHDLRVPFLCTSGKLDPMYAYAMAAADLSPYACSADLGDGAVFVGDRDPQRFVDVIHKFLSAKAPEIRRSMAT